MARCVIFLGAVWLTTFLVRRVPVRCNSSCDLYPMCGTEKNKLIYHRKDRLCPDVTIVSRQEWNAKPPKGPVDVINHPVAQVYIHHTDTSECHDLQSCGKILRGIQNYHFSLGWSDIGYSFLAGGDGKIYEGRGWGKVGAHTEGYNDMSYGTAFIGNFMSKLPNLDSMTAVKNLIRCGISLTNITQLYSLYGHRDACGDTDCPGKALYREIHQWKFYNRVPNPSAACVAKGRRCKKDKNTCKPGSLLNNSTLCKGPTKFCCYKP